MTWVVSTTYLPSVSLDLALCASCLMPYDVGRMAAGQFV